jgi:hypothetical protein
MSTNHWKIMLPLYACPSLPERVNTAGA